MWLLIPWFSFAVILVIAGILLITRPQTKFIDPFKNHEAEVIANAPDMPVARRIVGAFIILLGVVFALGAFNYLSSFVNKS